MFFTCPEIVFFDSCAAGELMLCQKSLLGEKRVKAAGQQLVSI